MCGRPSNWPICCASNKPEFRGAQRAADALAALRERRVDLLTTVGYQVDRERYMAYTLGTAPNPGAIIGRSADKRFANEPTLNGRRVAIERDYVTQFYVRRLYPETLVIDHPDAASALRAVALGEDDFHFGSLLMAMDRLQRDRIAGLAVKRSLIYATGLMHFGVRSDWAPLQVIMLALHRLGQGPLDAAQQQSWQLAQQASDSVLHLIDDVLDLARFEAGRVRLQLVNVALATMLTQLAAQHRLAADARGLQLALVDDDELSKMLTAEMLRRAGWVVLEAADAEAALPLWRQHGVAAVVSDRWMPGLDGPALLRQIGQEAADSGRTCPARLLCSGDAAPEGGLPDGIDAVLSKPVSAGVLMALLSSLGVRPAATGAGPAGAGAPAGPG